MKTQMFKLTIATVLSIVITAFAATSAAAKEKQTGSDSVFATGMKDGGRLVIKRSPSLGNRLIISLKIDGASTSIGYGHTYRTFLRPGHHTLSVMASPRPQNARPWEMSLDVQPGQTYTFVAQGGANRQLVLAKG
jgi:hypothetical protein